MADAPIKAYEAGCKPGRTYYERKSAHILPNEQPIRIPDTNKPIGTLSPRVMIAKPYQIKKYMMSDPKLR